MDNRYQNGGAIQNQPLAIDAKTLASSLRISLRHLRRLQASGQLPAPIRLGRAVRWRLSSIEEWLAKGAKPIQKK